MLPSRYLIVIRGNDLGAMTEEALHFAYYFLNRSLISNRQTGGNPEFEDFAVTILGLLQQYRHVYTQLPDAPNPEFREPGG
jgi:hypothetical protein